MTVARVIPSTTSHKREPVAAVLDLFARLGWQDIDLNLWPFMEEGEAIETAVDALARNGQRAGMVSGGWCDFFETGPPATTTRASVARQAGYARRLGATHLRLFYGRLPAGEYTPARLVAARDHLRGVADEHPDLMLVVENHGRGASGRVETCAEILAAVDRTNVRMNFDPINAEHAGSPALEALAAVRPFVAHVHLKGLAGQRSTASSAPASSISDRSSSRCSRRVIRDDSPSSTRDRTTRRCACGWVIRPRRS